MEQILVAAAIIRRDDAYLLARRCDGGSRDGMWEFPGGKIEAGETAEDGLIREIREELGATMVPGRRVATVEWDYPDVSIRLIGIAATLDNPRPVSMDLADHDRVTWATAGQARSLPLLPADRAMLDLLERETHAD